MRDALLLQGIGKMSRHMKPVSNDLKPTRSCSYSKEFDVIYYTEEIFYRNNRIEY